MRTVLLASTLLAMTAATPALAASGARPTYLDFTPGSADEATNRAKIQETLEIDSVGMAKKPVEHLMRGLAGQRVTFHFQGGPGTHLFLACPGSPGYGVFTAPTWSFDLPDSGDYLLRLDAEDAKEGASLPVSLEVELYTRKRPIPPSATGLYGRNGGEDAMIDVAQEADGTIRYYLFAFWKGGQLPEIAGRAPIEKDVATLKDGDCTMTLRFAGDKLEIQGQGTCPSGAQEAVFGTYQRLSRCGWPREVKK